jgi:CheY-like chemotaxis protein
MATILIVDDHADILEALVWVIEGAGHRALAVADGYAALECAATQKPDVVLLDIAMPGIDGLETLRRLKANPVTASIPVVMVTAIGTREFMVPAVQHGIRDYIGKPWEPGEVEIVVRRALRPDATPAVRAA